MLSSKNIKVGKIRFNFILLILFLFFFISYDLKSDGNRLTGLIAQDLEKVLPEAVYTAKDLEDEEHLAIRYGNTVGLLVEAIKELEARVKELEGK